MNDEQQQDTVIPPQRGGAQAGAALPGHLPIFPPDVPRPRSKPWCLGCSLCSPGSPSTKSKTTSSPTCLVASAVDPSRCHKVRGPLSQACSSPPSPSVASVIPVSLSLHPLVLRRHGICSSSQPSCSQRPLLLLLPPPDLLLPGGYTPDGAR